MSRNQWIAASVVATLALVLNNSGAQAALIIDNWTTTQGLIAGSPGGTVSSAAGGGMVGGFRRVVVTRTAGTTGPLVDANITGAGTLGYQSNSGVAGSARVMWDGMGGASSSINPIGLGGISLTSGGNTGISYSSLADLTGSTLRFRVYSSATSYSDATAAIPVSGTLVPNFISFASFILGMGATSPANFASVGAVELLGTGVTSGDFRVGAVSADTNQAPIPEPASATLLLLGAGVAGLGATWARRFRKPVAAAA